MSAFKDLTGMTFGRLKVLRRVENSPPTPSYPNGMVQYECQCSCPKRTIVLVRAGDLRTGNTVSCGCFQKEQISKTHTKDLTGKTFGRLTVIERAPSVRNHAHWRCKCSCPKQSSIVVSSTHLLTGHTTSCGCMKIDRTKEVNTKWSPVERDILENHYYDMMQRCYNPKNDHFVDYGARGIYVCDEWQSGESGKRAFVEWAKTHGFKHGLTIERIDVNGPYSPGNCTWITKGAQAYNTRRTICIEIDGRKLTLSQWARYLECGYWRLIEIYRRRGRDAVKRHIENLLEVN